MCSVSKITAFCTSIKMLIKISLVGKPTVLSENLVHVPIDEDGEKEGVKDGGIQFEHSI